MTPTLTYWLEQVQHVQREFLFYNLTFYKNNGIIEKKNKTINYQDPVIKLFSPTCYVEPHNENLYDTREPLKRNE